MATVFKKTPLLTDVTLHYCPGCGHGIVHRLVAEVIEELGVQEKAKALFLSAAQYSVINTLIWI